MKKLSKKQTAFLLSMVLLLVSGVLQLAYRPYIYKNHIFDFHFADTFSSWICVPCGALFSWSISKNTSFQKMILSLLLGFLIYEFIGLTFDWYDVVALFLSAGITYLAYFVYNKCNSSLPK